MCERIKDPVVRQLKEYLNKPSIGPSVLYSRVTREPSPAGKKLIEIEKGNIKHPKTVVRSTQKEEPVQPPPWTEQGYEEGVARHGATQTLFEAAKRQKGTGIDQKGKLKV
jgi:hypothetical protein